MIGISTLPFYKMSLKDALNIIEEKAEMAEIYTECHDVFNFEAFDSFNLVYTLHCPTTDINLASTIDKMREAGIEVIRDYISRASDIGAKRTIIHPGYYSDHTRKLSEEMHKRSLSEISKFKDEYGVEISIENMFWPFSFLRKAEEYKGFLEVLPLTFDVGHAHLNGEVKNFLLLKDRIVHVHLHDNKGESDEHLGLGKGKIDFSMVLPEIKSSDMIIEIKEKKDIDASLKMVRRYL